MCQVAAAVVVGGVRRSAMISLSNLTDDRMRHAKMGNWWNEQVNRSYANNSYFIYRTSRHGQLRREWTAIYESKSGERGIFNREAAKAKAADIGREVSDDFGTNPCGEISLRSKQFCNLSKLSSESKTELVTSKGKSKLQPSSGRFNQPLWTSNICHRNGKRTPKKKGY